MRSEDQQPPPYNHRTTSKILHHAFQTTLSLFPTTLFLTLLLFSFHTLIENSTVFLTYFIYNDPSLKSLLSSSNTTTTNTVHRPFLYLTRVGTLDDDLLSFDDVDDTRHLFGSRPLKVNSTFIPLGDVCQGIVSPGISFEFINQFDNSNNDKDDGNLGVVIGGLELGRRDVVTLCLLISILWAGFMCMIVVFLIVYSWAFGIVFVAVVNDLLGKYSPFSRNVWNGWSLGFKRLSVFFLTRWAVRDGVTQILCVRFFGQIGDLYPFFKLYSWSKLIPFSVSSPWVPGYDKEISGFLFSWFLVDSIVSLVVAVNSWVTIVDTRRGEWEIVKEGWYLLVTMIHQSIQLKSLELIFCGAFMRWVLAGVCGRSLASFFQSFAEVYFMVAWLIYYFAARCKDASLSGRRFGRTELEGLIQGVNDKLRT